MRAPAMRRQETREIHGAKCKLTLTRVTRDANFCGWRIKATIDGHIVTNDFTNILELDRAFDRAEERATEAIEGKRLGKKSDRIFSEIMALSVQETRDLFCYFFGIMQEQITDDDIELLENKLKEIEELREERDKKTMKKADEEIVGSSYYESLKENFPEDLEPVKSNLNDRDIHALAAAEESDLTKDIPTEELPEDLKGKSAAEVFDDSKFENNEADEEVDASDCCKREDPKCVQPPLRSSVQSSPDDPYYVCGYCGDVCELITIKRSELED